MEIIDQIYFCEVKINFKEVIGLLDKNGIF